MAKTAAEVPKKTLTEQVKSLNPLSSVNVRLNVSEYVFDEYSKQAIAKGEEVENTMANRLGRCLNHTANSPLYFNDEQRNELQRATGWSATDPAKVIARLREVSSVTLEDIKIEIPVRLRTRLESRVFKGQTFESMIRKEVLEALEKFVGIRPY